MTYPANPPRACRCNKQPADIIISIEHEALALCWPCSLRLHAALTAALQQGSTNAPDPRWPSPSSAVDD